MSLASERPSLLVFAAADRGGSAVEQLVVRAQWAAALDTVEKVNCLEACTRIVVATGAAELIERLDGLPVAIEPDEQPFHFGQLLRRLIRKYQIKRALYIGAGSAVLMTLEDFRTLFSRLASAEFAVIPNNLWSSDFVGFVPADAIERIDPPAIDNNLAFLLNREAGLPEIALPFNAATQFDIDTPTDLLVLALRCDAGYHVRRYLDLLQLDTERIGTVARQLTDTHAEVVVIGRVGPAAWLHLERDTACRVRLFSEERGMRASGREERGLVRSLLGFYLERHGSRGLFDALAELGDAAIIDSRVLFAHLSLSITAADRFHSDLLQVERIVNPLVREFTASARDARIPVVLGGHSLVSGGLWALIEAAWRLREGVG